MKIYKLEKVADTNGKIIRITFKKFWGGLKVRDVMRDETYSKYWNFVGGGEIEDRFRVAVNTFAEMGVDSYYVNGK